MSRCNRTNLGNCMHIIWNEEGEKRENFQLLLVVWNYQLIKLESVQLCKRQTSPVCKHCFHRMQQTFQTKNPFTVVYNFQCLQSNSDDQHFLQIQYTLSSTKDGISIPVKCIKSAPDFIISATYNQLALTG